MSEHELQNALFYASVNVRVRAALLHVRQCLSTGVCSIRICVWSGRGGARLWGWGLSHCVREKEEKRGRRELSCM